MSTGKRMPLFYAFMLRFNTILAIAAWPLFLLVAFTQDWTVIFVPLLISAGVGMMWLSLRKQYGSPRQVRPTPDYSLIASMERPIWGEAFEHAGAPAPRTARQNVTDARITEMHRAGYRPAEIAGQLGLVQQSVIHAITSRSKETR